MVAWNVTSNSLLSFSVVTGPETVMLKAPTLIGFPKGAVPAGPVVFSGATTCPMDGASVPGLFAGTAEEQAETAKHPAAKTTTAMRMIPPQV